MTWKSLKKVDLTQAGGAQTFDLTGFEGSYHHQLQISPSATPSAGTITVSILTPGASDYIVLDGTIDMTGSDLITTFDCFAESVRITPAGFDADKTYDAFLMVSEKGGN